MTDLISAYVNFLKGKERADIERAVMANTFAPDYFGTGMFNKFVSLVAEQNAYNDVFLSFTNNKQKSMFASKMQDEGVTEVERMRQYAIDNAEFGEFDTDPQYWFNTITNKIDILKEIENILAENLSDKASLLKKNAVSNLYFLIMLTIISLLSAGVAAYVVTKNITARIGVISSAADQIARGNVDLSLEDLATDEIGKLVNSFRELINTIADKTLAASEIANGNLNVKVKVASADDSLGNAMTNMVNNLRKIIAELTETSTTLSSSSDDLSTVSSQMASGCPANDRRIKLRSRQLQ